MRKVLPPTLNWRAVASNELTVYFCSYLHNPQHHVRILLFKIGVLFMYVPCNSRRSSFMASIRRIFWSILNDTELPKSSCIRSQCWNPAPFYHKHVQKQWCFIQIASQWKHRNTVWLSWRILHWRSLQDTEYPRDLFTQNWSKRRYSSLGKWGVGPLLIFLRSLAHMQDCVHWLSIDSQWISRRRSY